MVEEDMTKVTAYSVARKTGLLSKGEVDFIKKMVRMVHVPGLYTEVVIIGAGSGTSALAVLEADLDAIIFSIDNEFPTGHRYTPGEKQNLIDAGYWDKGNVIQIIGESQLVGKRWPYPCDLLFIDGDHRYPYVRDDIIAWLPTVRTGKIIAFHDYGTKEIKPKAGVKQAVDELIVNNDRVEVEDIGYERFTKAFKVKRAVMPYALDIYG